MPLKYAYLFGCFILFTFWLVIFLLRKDLRKEMIWASLVGLPFGFIDYFLIPNYWHPDVIFDFGIKHGLGIESFLFFGLMAGISSVIYEFMEKEKLVKMRGDKSHHFLVLVFLFSLFMVLAFSFPKSVVYSLMMVLSLGAIMLILLRRDLLKHIVMSGFIFTIFYFIIFVIMKEIFINIVPEFYNVSGFWNILIVGVPIEELLVSFSGGMFWSALYVYIKSYRER